MNSRSKLLCQDYRQLNEGNLKLFLLHLEKEFEENSSGMAIVSQKLKNLNLDHVPDEDKSFVLSKCLVHFTLLDHFVEAVGVDGVVSIPHEITSNSNAYVRYKSKGYNHDVDLQYHRKETPGPSEIYTFVLINFNTCKTSDPIMITKEEIGMFMDMSNVSITRKLEIGRQIANIILAFLRGKKSGSTGSITPIENPSADAAVTEALYLW